MQPLCIPQDEYLNSGTQESRTLAIVTAIENLFNPTTTPSTEIDENLAPLKPRHRCKEASMCGMVSLEQGQEDSIINIVNGGGIPFLTYSSAYGSGNNKLKLRCKSQTHRFRCVAISHVRTDGLGNSEANSLPACVLEWLQAMVDEMYDITEHPVPFWIDTICLPIKRQTRKSIIKHLRPTFSACDRVLVLESSLYNELASLPAEQYLLIKKSAWLTRLWTLQEGAVAKELYFRFQGHFRQLEPLLVNCKPGKESELVSSKFLEELETSDSVGSLHSDIQFFEHLLNSIPDSVPRADKYKLRAILRLGYLSFPRFRYFATAEQMEMIPRVLDEMKQVHCSPLFQNYIATPQYESS